MIPASYAQRRLWLVDRLEGPSALYTLPLVLRLTGRPDVAALRAALHDVVARHEALRTRFRQVDGEPVQEIVPVGDLADLLTEDRARADELEDEIGRTARHVFDLSSDIPFHARLLTVDDRTSALVIALHHIAADGWSAAPLWRDLSAAYAARARRRRTGCRAAARAVRRLHPVAARTARRRRRPRQPARRQLAYWRPALAARPEELALPTDRPRPAAAAPRRRHVRLDVPADLHARLAELARAQNATMFMVWHAALAVLLSKLGAGDDIPIGSPFAGRDEADLEDLVGFFVNTLVLRTDLTGDPAFTEVVRRVRGDRRRRHEPPGRALRAARGGARPGPLADPAPPLPGQPHPAQHPARPRRPARSRGRRRVRGAAAGQVRPRLQVLEHFDRRGRPAGQRVELHYSADLFDRATAEALADRLLRVLRQAVRTPDLPLARRRRALARRTREPARRGGRHRGPAARRDPARPLRRPGRRPPRRRRPSATRRPPHLRRTGRRVQPARPAAGRPRRGPRDPGRRRRCDRAPDLVVALLAVTEGGRRATCRSTPPTRPSGSRPCSPTPPPPSLLTTAARPRTPSPDPACAVSCSTTRDRR